MKGYVMTTGAVFALLVAVHVWRAVVEGKSILTDPWWYLITAIAAGLALWAGWLLRRAPRASS